MAAVPPPPSQTAMCHIAAAEGSRRVGWLPDLHVHRNRPCLVVTPSMRHTSVVSTAPARGACHEGVKCSRAAQGPRVDIVVLHPLVHRVLRLEIQAPGLRHLPVLLVLLASLRVRAGLWRVLILRLLTLLAFSVRPATPPPSTPRAIVPLGVIRPRPESEAWCGSAGTPPLHAWEGRQRWGSSQATQGRRWRGSGRDTLSNWLQSIPSRTRPSNNTVVSQVTKRVRGSQWAPINFEIDNIFKITRCMGILVCLSLLGSCSCSIVCQFSRQPLQARVGARFFLSLLITHTRCISRTLQEVDSNTVINQDEDGLGRRGT